MEYAIVHNQSLNVLEKHAASSVEECREKYLAAHPEFECDTFGELQERFPVLLSHLLMVPLC